MTRPLAIRVTAMLALVGCGGGETVPPPPLEAVGTWNLISYNGEPLPTQRIGRDGIPQDIIAGSVGILRGSHFARSTRVVVTSPLLIDTVSFGEQGDWEYTNDGVLILIPVGEDSRSAYVTNNQLTVIEGENKIFVYARKP